MVRIPSVDTWTRVYERYISPISLVAGFFVDNLILLRRIDEVRSNVILLSYLCIAVIGIIVTNLVADGRWKHPLATRYQPFVFIAMQFAFGGLLSGYVSLYSRSASIGLNWIFVIAMALLLVGNERFMRFYKRMSFQMTLFFVVLYSFLIFFLPVVTHQIGTGMFLLSGVVSVLIVVIFMWFLHTTVPRIESWYRVRVWRNIAITSVVFIVLYVSNIIPPLPLALKNSGAFYLVQHIDTTYQLTTEPQSWLQKNLHDTVLYLPEGMPAYVYSAIFSPTGISTTVEHQWQKYDSLEKKWNTIDGIAFQINGGRENGYRGYTYLTNISPGEWRVNVLLPDKRVVGRVNFTVVRARSTPVSLIIQND